MDEAVLTLTNARNTDRYVQDIVLMNQDLIGVLVLKDMFCLPMKDLAKILTNVNKGLHLVGDPINIVSILVEDSNVLVSIAKKSFRYLNSKYNFELVSYQVFIFQTLHVRKTMTHMEVQILNVVN